MKKKNKIDGISMQCFVDYYLGTKHSCSKLKHQGLKSFNNPYVIGVSNDFALKYPDCVMRQELIVVIDDYGNPGTYINPTNIQKLIELETCKEKLKLLENISCYNFEEVALLYQLWMSIAADIRYLGGLYGSTYDLLYLINKGGLLRNIRKCAKEEAKRTLIFTKPQNGLDSQEVSVNYNDVLEDEIFNVTSEQELVIEYLPEDYQITEKVNRQRKLKFKTR